MSESDTSHRLPLSLPPVQITPLALVLILIGYLTVWLPLPPAGLRLVGFEMGEWVKFLPEARAGLLPSRNFFYLPPITLAALLLVWTAEWPAARLRTWGARGVALAVSLLAWPSLDVIRFEPAPEWRLRVAWVALILLLALIVGRGRRWPRLLDLALILLGLIGFGLPGWAYEAYRPVIASWTELSVGIGPGVWLNSAGHLLLVGIGLRRLLRRLDASTGRA